MIAGVLVRGQTKLVKKPVTEVAAVLHLEPSCARDRTLKIPPLRERTAEP
jgi:hypothetical protein